MSPADDLIRLRLDVSYDGTDFVGWAAQPEQRSVQQVLEEAAATVLRVETVRLVVAGRTDAGVHAQGQVAHVDVPAGAYRAVERTFPRRLAGVLPTDVRVNAVGAVTADFDARFAALWRHYSYRICDSEVGPSPLRRRDTAAWKCRLDAEAMIAGAAMLVGLHDFAAFCRRRDGATTIRELQQLQVTRTADLITIDARADAFCHSMVRSLVGALAAVGAGRQNLAWLAGLLTQSMRADEIVVAPARGLSLIEVGYPAADQLAARGRETRTTRTIAGREPLPYPPRSDPAGEIIDLSVLVTSGMPVYPGDPEVQLSTALTLAADGVNVARLHLGSQSGTHIDAPNHTVAGASELGDLPLSRFTGVAVVADLRGLSAGCPISVEHLAPIMDRLAPGRVLLLCTGWSKYWQSPRYLDHPWLTPAATSAVLTAGVRTVGVDALSIDASPVTSTDGLASHHLIAAVDGVIIENLTALGQLLDGRDYEVSVFPLKLDVSDGAPVRAIARPLNR